jgi:hypothetical protein
MFLVARPKRCRSLTDFLKFFYSYPQSVISGGRGGKTVEKRLDVVIFVVMKKLFTLLRRLQFGTVEGVEEGVAMQLQVNKHTADQWPIACLHVAQEKRRPLPRN